jgi:hypothetical protein
MKISVENGQVHLGGSSQNGVLFFRKFLSLMRLIDILPALRQDLAACEYRAKADYFT